MGVNLFAYNLSGLTDQRVGLDVSSWSDDLSGATPFIVSTGTTYSGYSNISSITNWDTYGYEVGLNNGGKRKEIKEIFINNTGTTWSGYTVEEKKVLSKYFLVEKSKRDEVLTQQEQDGNNHHRIYDLINSHISTKNVHDINYKTELISNVKLHSIYTLTNDGFLEKTEWYDGYVDSLNKGELVLTVEESYVLHDDGSGLNLTARPVISRDKIRKWVKHDDIIDSEEDSKITHKIYDTSNKKSNEGQRRRNNIVDILANHTAMGGILSGTFSSENDANNKLTEIMEDFSGGIASYIKTGRGGIYNLMENTTGYTWLDTVVVDTPQTQAMVPFMIGNDLRSYIIEKLKGNTI